MSSESVLIQPLLDQLRRGDPSAIGKLTELTYDRLRRLAGKMLNQSFGPLGRQHDLDSVLNTTFLTLHTALTAMAAEAKTPPTPADFFRFAAFKVRQVLLDMVGKDRRRQAKQREFEWDSDQSGWVPPPWWADGGPPPETQANWGEFLERVDGLPEPERDVFQMHFIMDMTQAEIARETGLEPKQVSRAWLKAAAAVGKFLPA
jgi:RNA polymerase sigma factor (sigma-70 family)